MSRNYFLTNFVYFLKYISTWFYENVVNFRWTFWYRKIWKICQVCFQNKALKLPNFYACPLKDHTLNYVKTLILLYYINVKVFPCELICRRKSTSKSRDKNWYLNLKVRSLVLLMIASLHISHVAGRLP